MQRGEKGKSSVEARYTQLASEGGSRAKDAGAADPVARARAIGYSDEEIRSVPESSLMGLGCGNPTALADLREGETVLDLGCGGGLDVFLAARKVGRSSKVIGIDATAAMVEKAKAAAAKASYENVEFRVGRIEALPLADQSVDVVLSNCVMNHAADKGAAFREAWRVLRAGGRMLISDLVTAGPLPPPGTPGLEIWTEWLAVATGRREYLDAIAAAGFREVTILDERHWSSPAMAEPLRGKIVSLYLKAWR
jgi:SAM-dependent methyltransferase